eukprot:TRINITY_DN90591_c0_g1_i1.p1 TRINITY_DN90591_c0_g1~~TRINITY_DN90591_c0_g1_i1.p1  ORF type:complete len:494 (-),score=134.57 TRINITY_DN90591_c0_g1_i1:52-1533(-)
MSCWQRAPLGCILLIAAGCQLLCCADARSGEQLMRSQRGGSLDVASTAAGQTLELFFVTDCSHHQKWMAYNTFNSARLAGHVERITWVRSGCKQPEHHSGGKPAAAALIEVDSAAGTQAQVRALQAENAMLRRVRDELLEDRQTGISGMATKLYPNSRVVEVRHGANTDNFNMKMGVPKAVESFLEEHKELQNQTVLALIEADMLFLSKLRLDDLESRGIRTVDPHKDLLRHNGALVGGNIGVAQHYQCCDDLGPPYILAVEGWKQLAPHWSQAKAKMDGWGGDQVAFARAAREAGLHFNVFDHFMVSDQNVEGEGWSLVNEAMKLPAGDVCATREWGGERPAPSPNAGLRLPTFLHMVRPWSLLEHMPEQAWGFSKYQVPPGWSVPSNTDGILECEMPMFAEPPASLLQEAKPQGQKAAQEAWGLCSIISSLNSMLLSYKQAKCNNRFNTAKAVKMKVPLSWANILLEGGVKEAPTGTNMSWLHSCVETPRC